MKYMKWEMMKNKKEEERKVAISKWKWKEGERVYKEEIIGIINIIWE